MNENLISEEFNEIDEEGNILRIITNFKLFDSNNNLISFNEFEERKEKIRLEGILIEPLKNKWKEKLLEILCSRPPPELSSSHSSHSNSHSSSSTTSNNNNNSYSSSSSVVSAQPPLPIPINDWEILSVGNLVDGYCTRTLKWYEAKILEIDRSISNDNPLGNVKSVKIHFKGWNSKYDEWIIRGSPRLSLHGATTEKKSFPYSAYTAWYENSIAYQKVIFYFNI